MEYSWVAVVRERALVLPIALVVRDYLLPSTTKARFRLLKVGQAECGNLAREPVGRAPGPVVLAAGSMFLAPSILRELSHRLHQSRVLWQILPTGLAGLAMILGLEIVLKQSFSQWLGDHPDFSIIFISLLALFLTMSILGILGREPTPGARHWTQNPTFRFWRRFGAVSVFIMLFLFTGML